VRVASGNPVVVFNVCGNHFRLVCAIHYNNGKVFLLRFLTHAEYDKNRWKDEL
jgi:mRNA interferase HigB